jgi:hypothetical protein
VSTEVFGAAVLFRVDRPEIAEREEMLARPEYVDGRSVPTGSVVRRPKIPAGTVLVGSASIYQITPCTEEACKLAIIQNLSLPLVRVRLPEGHQLAAAPDPFEPDDEEHDDPPVFDMTTRQLYEAYRDNFPGQNLKPWEIISNEEQSGWVGFLADLKEEA